MTTLNGCGGESVRTTSGLSFGGKPPKAALRWRFAPARKICRDAATSCPPIFRPLRSPSLRCPKNVHARRSSRAFFDRCGTRASPASPTGSGEVRAPTSCARRNNPEGIGAHHPKQKEKASDGCFSFWSEWR